MRVAESRAVRDAGRAELLLAAAAIDAIASAPGNSSLASSVAAVLREVASSLRDVATLGNSSEGSSDA